MAAKKNMIISSAFLVVLALFSIDVLAADYYVRDGSGLTSSCGGNWTNACEDLNNFASLKRNSTYYLADGNYSSYTFDDAVNGTQYITIKKATISDHGTSIGWDDVYGDGQAFFNSTLTFSYGYVLIDGKTGGGPDGWDSGFGFVISDTKGWHRVVFNADVNYVIFNHTEIKNTDNTADDVDYGHLIDSQTGVSFITFSHCKMHHVFGCVIKSRANADNWVVEYSKLGDNTGTSGNHSEIWSLMGNDNITLRYSWIYDWRSTGGIVAINGPEGGYDDPNICEDYDIYGNIFIQNGTTAPYLITAINDGSNQQFARRWKAYNNLFIDVNSIDNSVQFYRLDVYAESNNEFKNNIIYGSTDYLYITNTDEDYNSYTGDGSFSGLNDQLLVSSPFINYSNADYRLISPLEGVSLTSEYDKDMNNNTRGEDGVWDQGAYEYVGNFVQLLNVNGSVNTTFTNITACANVVGPGQTCLVYGGDYDEVVSPARSGNSTHFIIFQTNQSAKVKSFSILNKNYIRIQGFEITNEGFALPQSNTAGIELQSANHTEILNNYIHNNYIYQCIREYYGTSDYVVIRDNTISNCGFIETDASADDGAAGIMMQGDYNLIERNNISRVTDFITLCGSYDVVRNNLFYDVNYSTFPNTTNDMHVDGVEYCSNLKWVLIENNTLHDSRVNNSHFILLRNTEFSNSSDEIIRFNTVYDVGSGFIVLSDNFPNVRIYHNTVANMQMNFPTKEYVDLSFSVNSTGGKLINNIFYNDVSNNGYLYYVDASSLPGFYASNNMGYNSDCDTSCSWQTPLTGAYKDTLLNQNPLFINASNNFNLQNDSPAINQGGQLTYVSVADIGTGTSLILDDSGMFQDGYNGIINPDWIAVGNVNNVVQIVSINYTTNTITLNNSINRNDNDSVWLYKDSNGRRVLYEDAPDIGAYEYDPCANGANFTILNSTHIQACSCNQTHVQAAMNNATDGMTVLVPAGNCSWSSAVSVDLSSEKSITISGAGVAPSFGSANRTVIINNGFDIILSANNRFRLTNIMLKGDADTYGGMIEITGTSLFSQGGFRIDHITFDNVCYVGDCRAMIIQGRLYGVIDSNIGGSGRQFAHISEELGGNPSWSRTPSFGTHSMVYFENNNLAYGHAGGEALMMIGDGTNGARIVYRNNILTDYYVGGHDLSTEDRSIHSFEVYSNDMTTTASYGSSVIDLRGGTGYVYNNSIFATDATPFYTSSAITMQNYRSQGSTWNALGSDTGCDNVAEKSCLGTIISPRSCTNDGDCGGENGSCRNVDTNFAGNGWPCGDQIGRTTNQTSQPTLFWNNRLKIQANAFTNITPALVDSGASYAIQINRDYCHNNQNMPTSCNTTITNYAAYIYPHPLTVAPYNTSICGEGVINSTCWCEGMKNNGTCNHGYYTPDLCSNGANFTILNATHIQACSCNQTNVQAAINNASDGITVLVPAGNCTWVSPITMPSSKSWILEGDSANTTHIFANGNNLIIIPNMINRTGEIRNINWNGPASGYLFDSASYLNTNGCRNLLIHNNIFNDCLAAQTAGCIRLGGPCPAVIYNNQFICTNGTKCAIDINSPDDADWNSTINIGGYGQNMVFIENNYFQHQYNARKIVDNSPAGEHNWLFIDTTSGGRFVARYNVFKNGYVSGHGTCYSSGVRGTVQREIYNNWIYHETGYDCGTGSCDLYRAVNILSGTGLIANNIIGGDVMGGIGFNNDRSNGDCNFGAICNGTNVYDMNFEPISSYHGYMCLDQPGASGAQNNQISSPIYIWGNKKCSAVSNVTSNCLANPSSCVAEAYSNCTTTLASVNVDGTNFSAYHFMQNRDYFNTTKPGYAPFDYPHPLVSGIPGVSLLSPQWNYSTNSTNIAFNCSAIDSGNLVNITLYSNFSGSWTANETKNINGTYNETSFTKTLSAGNYEWNCYACDVDGNCDFGNLNYTLTVNLVPAPLVQRLNNMSVVIANYTTVQACANAVVAGQTCLVHEGEYDEYVTESSDGTAQNRITFKANGSVRVGGFDLSGEYIVIDGFNLTGANVPAYDGAVNFNTGSSYGVAKNMIIKGLPLDRYGILCEYDSVTNLTIENNSIGDCNYPHISLRGAYHVISNNTFSGTTGWDAIRLLSSYSHIVGNSLINFTGSNETYEVTHGDFIQAFSENGETSLGNIIENNYINNIYYMQICNIDDVALGNIANWTFRNNVFIGPSMQCNMYAPGMRWYGNTFYNMTTSTGHVLQFKGSGIRNYAHNSEVYNNIFSECGSSPSNQAQGWYSLAAGVENFTSDYNLVIGAGTNKTGFNETHGLNGVNPQFVNISNFDLHLQPTSQAIDAGADLSSHFTTDFEGNTRPQGSGWDIGAYEYVGGSNCSEADVNGDGSISDSEMQDYTNLWILSINDVTLNELIVAMREWKNGC